jgi:L,D-peptidoglycan transpeptidase YkuD (ErfK/YbiS/YcfS/YnhG family)
MRLANILFIFVCLIFIFSCKNEKSTPIKKEETQPLIEQEIHLIDNILGKYNLEKDIRQIILSYNQNQSETTGQLVGFEKIEGKWQSTFDTIDVNFGKNGFALYNEKMEGDGKSPTGVFEVGKAFGYADDIPHNIDFITLNENHYWDSDSKSATYNQLLTEKPATSLMEVMRRKDHLYKYGIIIEYNTKQAIPEKGSAIFLHVQRRKAAYTSGCISMEEEDIIRLIEWLNSSQQPMIVMGNWSELTK